MISQIYRNRKFGRSGVVLKLEFEVKLADTHQTVAQQPDVPLWGRATVWWCSITFLLPFNPSLNFLKFRLQYDPFF